MINGAQRFEFRTQKCLLVVLVFVTVSLPRAAYADPITLMYHERPPYYIAQEGGGIVGLIAEPTTRAFEKVGIEFDWTLIAANRQLDIVKANQTRTCAVGWFRNVEREVFARYSVPIHQDKPMIAIVATENTKIRQHRTVEQLLADEALVMGKKLGYSYGDIIDTLILTHDTRTVTSAQSNVGLIRMLLAERFDFAFFPGDEVGSIVIEVGESAAQLSMVSLQGMPEGSKRYILCSHLVAESTMARLDAEIEKNAP